MKQFDERDVLFSRIPLAKGTKEYKTYYTRHPENEEIDEKFRVFVGEFMKKKLGKENFDIHKILKLMHYVNKLPISPMRKQTSKGGACLSNWQ